MNSWKSFVKNVADKASDFSSPVRVAGGNVAGEDTSGDAQAEGFICPMCMKGFLDPVQLQQHFENEHSNSPPSSMTNSSNGTGEEERRYSAQLQREVDQFSEDVQRTTNNIASNHDDTNWQGSQFLEEEKALLETQVTALEEGKRLLSSEVDQLKRNLEETQQKLGENEVLLKTTTEKASIIAAENVDLKSSLDEMKTQTQVAEEKVKILNSVVEQRNNVDDVAVLRNELHNVQTLMMSDLNEIKTDTKLDDLRLENDSLKSELSTISFKQVADEKTHNLELKYAQDEKNRLQSENDKLSSKIENLLSNVTSSEEITTSERRKTDQIQHDLKQRTKELLAAKVDLDEFKERSRVKLEEEISKAQKIESALSTSENKLNGSIGHSNDIAKELTVVQGRCNEQMNVNDEVKGQLLEKTNALEDALRHNINKTSEIDQVKGQVHSLQKQISQLNTEREELLGQIEAGDGASNTAIQQLKLQNENLTKKIQSVNIEKQEITEQNKRKVEELHSLLNETKLGLASANEKLKALDSEKSDLTSKHSVLLKEKEKVEQNLQDKSKLVAENKAESEKQIRQIQAQLETAENANKTSIAQCEDLEKKQTHVLAVMKEKESQNSELIRDQKSKSQEIQTLSQTVTSLNDQLASKSDQINRLTASNAEVSTNVAALNTQKTRLDGQLKESTIKIRKITDEKKEIVVQLEEANKKCSVLEHKLSDIQKKVEHTEKSMKALNDETNVKLKENTNIIEAAKEQNKDLQLQLQSKSSLLEDLSSKNSDLETQMECLQKQLKDQINEQGEIEKRICVLQSTHEKEKSQFEGKMKDLQSAKDLLLNSKLGLQNELEDASSRTNILKQEIEKVKGSSRKAEDKLQSELSQLKAEVAKQLAQQNELENRVSEKESELEEAIISSKEAIVAANEKEKLSQDKLIGLNKQLDHAVSAKLELEAKVESTSDELRSLLERCLGAESELERSRSSLIELRRKLDDSQAALHELGRENQSIQVDLVKQSGRKWADDAEANTCMACQSTFSITNRKHHCRNCGQIFCAECSAKQAMMQNYKKPQRVCEPCFGELQQGK